MEHAYWGQEHDAGRDRGCPATRDGVRLRARRATRTSWSSRVVGALAAGQVVGWFQGRFEWGPRALGNRSILADPRRADMKDIVNTKIKFREPFRPFAPSVLVERAEELLRPAPTPARHYPAPLHAVRGRRSPRTSASIIPAVTHVDGTGRLQTVHATTNPRYYRLIERFGQATGVPVILNTSFNLRGEPIVTTPAEAFSTFTQSGMDVLVLGDYLIEKPAARR